MKNFYNDSYINTALKIFKSKLITKDFTKVRNRVKIAIESSPKLVSFEQALKQVNKLKKNKKNECYI